MKAHDVTRPVILLLLLTACRPGGGETESSATVAQEQPSAAERVIRRQYEAYNRRDLEAFVAAHAPNVRFYRYPDSLAFQGRDAIRERFGKMFTSSPQLHATVEARMAQGDIVVWKETATGLPGGRSNTAIFVWEVKNDLITKVMMVVP
jgi:hypothetical protein